MHTSSVLCNKDSNLEGWESSGIGRGSAPGAVHVRTMAKQRSLLSFFGTVTTEAVDEAVDEPEDIMQDSKLA